MSRWWSSRWLFVAKKELLQLKRDRMTVALMAALPLLQLMLFGYAIDTDVRHIATVVYDRDSTAASRALARSLEATRFFDLHGNVNSFEEAEHALRAGHAGAALVIPQRYSADIAAGKPVRVQLMVDGSDPQLAVNAVNTASSLVAARAGELSVKRLRRLGLPPQPEPLGLEPSILYNADLRSAVNIIPGLIGVLLTMTMVMITSMAMARERERGTLEQLIVSPIGRFELVIGKIAPYIAIGYVQMGLILVLGRVVFHVPMRGSLLLLFALAFVFIAANLAIGLFFSAVSATQQQAMQLSFFFLLPNILVSGFMFPFEAMPRPAQWLAQAIPLTHFLRVVRGIVLKSATFADLFGEFIWMTALLIALLALSAVGFRNKLG
jgi:ABC-2 type transport system permease protein